MQAIIALRQARAPLWREVSPAPLRFVTFVFVGMPLVFVTLIYFSAFLMHVGAGWTHERSLHFMASAFTGGAIVLPHEPPHHPMTKLLGAILGAAGVGIFGFLVAALLDSGMVAPIIWMCRLKMQKNNPGPYEKGVHVFVSFVKVAIFAVSLNFLAAIFFAWIMRLSEGWGWFEAIKAMISVGLGGGVVYRDMGTPRTENGTFVFIVVSCWAIGTAALMIATAAEAFMDNTEDFEAALTDTLQSQPVDNDTEDGGAASAEGMVMDYDDEDFASEGAASGSKSTFFMASQQLGAAVVNMSSHVGVTVDDYRILRLFLVFVFMVLPVVLLMVMLFVASCMSALTNWEFTNAFWISLPAVTGGACSLTANTNPQLTYWGAFVMFFASNVGFLALNIAMGVGAKFIAPFIRDRPYLDKERGKGTAVSALFVICWVLIPITVFALSVPLGALMALLEGWRFVDGFWWCVAVQCGGGMALTDATIERTSGMWIAAVAVAWSIGISIMSIGLSGAPVVSPAMSAIGMNMQDELKHLLPLSPRRHGTGLFRSFSALGHYISPRIPQRSPQAKNESPRVPQRSPQSRRSSI